MGESLGAGGVPPASIREYESAPGETRTPDPRIRHHILGHLNGLILRYIQDPPPIWDSFSPFLSSPIPIRILADY